MRDAKVLDHHFLGESIPLPLMRDVIARALNSDYTAQLGNSHIGLVSGNTHRARTWPPNRGDGAHYFVRNGGPYMFTRR